MAGPGHHFPWPPWTLLPQTPGPSCLRPLGSDQDYLEISKPERNWEMASLPLLPSPLPPTAEGEAEPRGRRLPLIMLSICLSVFLCFLPASWIPMLGH